MSCTCQSNDYFLKVPLKYCTFIGKKQPAPSHTQAKASLPLAAGNKEPFSW